MEYNLSYGTDNLVHSLCIYICLDLKSNYNILSQKSETNLKNEREREREREDKNNTTIPFHITQCNVIIFQHTSQFSIADSR